MRLIGFNFGKISIEKTQDKLDGLKITTNIDISSLEEIKQDIFKSNESILRVKFSYNVNYEPSLAKLELKGDLVVSLDPILLKNALKEWKDKKIPTELKTPLFNLILRKSTLKALELEDELNLPLHIPLPQIKKVKKG